MSYIKEQDYEKYTKERQKIFDFLSKKYWKTKKIIIWNLWETFDFWDKKIKMNFTKNIVKFYENPVQYTNQLVYKDIRIFTYQWIFDEFDIK